MSLHRTCGQCGAPFTAKYRTSEQRFCSRECVREYRAVEGVGGQPWTDEELGFLMDHEHWTARQVAEVLGRGMQAVQKKREQLRDGWAREKEPWTDDELDIVRATPNLTAQQVAARLPGRTRNSVEAARAKLAHAEGLRFSFYPGDKKNAHHVGRRRLLARTCPDCGLFLDASWFGFNTRKWRHACVKCQSRKSYPVQRERRGTTYERDGGESARRIAGKLQALSLPHAVNSGQPWTEADMTVLSDPDLTAIEKALKLGRTYFATHTACQTYGFTSRVGRGDPIHGTWIIHFQLKENAA